MIKPSYFLFAWMCFSLATKAQTPQEINYNELITKSEGKSISWKEKSRVSGYVYTQSVKIGEWKYYDEFGTLLKTENYKKTGKHESVKDGVWEYFDAYGDRVKAEVYQNGVSAEVQYFAPCIIKEGGYSYHIQLKDTVFVETAYRGSIKLSETVYRGNIRLLTKYFSALEQKLVDANKTVEEKHGNPLLMETSPVKPENLIYNAGFEEHPGVKFSITSVTNQIPGLQIVSGTPDFYMNSPTANRTGLASLGFRVFTLIGNDIEYFALTFTDSLKKDSMYCFSFYLKLGTESDFATNVLGVIFTRNVLKFDKLEKSIPPHISLKNNWLVYKSGWMRMECTFRAKGGERYVNIGTFVPDKDLPLLKSPGMIKEAYYYIDDVSLSPIENADECKCNAEIPVLTSKHRWGIFELDTGKVFNLENVFFDNDKYDLLPQSFEVLDNLIQLMKDQPTLAIQIQGHTSSVASREHNLLLSAQRAETVKNYLLQAGISQDRITAVGLGPDFPIADNATADGQSKNRRVVFKVMKL